MASEPWDGRIRADARHLPIASETVQCCVTSPPYWGLRDYKQNRQIGLEPTPREYLNNIREVALELWRVLRDDGTLWLNLGDSYATGGGSVGRAPGGGDQGERFLRQGMIETQPNRMRLSGLKSKDLVGMPWRVALALQEDGWYLRSDIIWHKPNPMPESVTDRPTRAHEYIFLLTKSERYFYNTDAIREPHARDWEDESHGFYSHQSGELDGFILGRKSMPHCGLKDSNLNPLGRNKRSVWTISTQPYPEAHYATFPEEIPELCIKAGSRPGGKRCDCMQIISTPLGSGEIRDPSLITGRAGMNRERRANEGTRPITRRQQRSDADQIKNSPRFAEIESRCGAGFEHYIRTDIAGARPIPAELREEFIRDGWLFNVGQCECPDQPADIVLDPFFGSGTVGRVAERLSRRWIGCDLGYQDLQAKRLSDIQRELILP